MTFSTQNYSKCNFFYAERTQECRLLQLGLFESCHHGSLFDKTYYTTRTMYELVGDISVTIKQMIASN